jgi:glycosyltransferase involved in cell wall biosynthesis
VKILFLSDNFVPETNAPAHRTYEHCRKWVQLGAEVTVITGFPNFPYGKVYTGYKNKLYEVERIDGIRVVRVWTYMSENKGFFKRVMDFMSYMVSSFIAGLFIQTDLIIATSPQFFTAISGRWLSFWKRRKWVMEVRDLWPESLKVVGAMRDNWLLRYFEWVEGRLYKSASKIVTATAYIRDFISNQHGIDKRKIQVIRNGVDLSQFAPMPKDQELIKELGLEGKFIVGYIGTHGMAHALDFILRSISKLDTQDIHFIFVGSGAAKKELLDLRNELKLTNATFLDPVPKEEVKRYISILDMGLVNLRDSPVFRGALPSKMNELAAMGKPVLLGVKGEAEAFLREFNLGEVFYPEDEESFLVTIKNLDQSSANLNSDASQVREQIDRDQLAKAMLNFISDSKYQ